MSMNGPLNG